MFIIYFNTICRWQTGRGMILVLLASSSYPGLVTWWTERTDWLSRMVESEALLANTGLGLGSASTLNLEVTLERHLTSQRLEFLICTMGRICLFSRLLWRLNELIHMKVFLSLRREELCGGKHRCVTIC